MSMAQVLKLKPAFNDEQAQALAGLFDEELATKRDIAALSTDVERVKAELERFKVEIKADLEKLRLEVQRDLKAQENSILTRMMTLFIGQGLAVVSLVVALQRLLG